MAWASRTVSRTAWLATALAAVVVSSSALASKPGPTPPPPSPDVLALVARLGLQESPEPVRQRKGWAPPKTVLVATVRPDMLPALQQVAPGVKLIAADSPEQAVALAKHADVVLGFCTPEVLAAGKQIRWVQSFAAGVERCVTISAIAERDILLTNMQRVAGPVMAEHVLAMMFAFARGLDFYIPERLEHRWTEELPPTSRMITLEGKTVLVVGLGGIGAEVAKRAHALGMEVDAIRATGREGPDYIREVGLPEDLARLSSRADFIVNATPLTAATHHLFDARFFDGLKPGAYFFNVGRGQSVVQDALIDALKRGKLGGAGLDVTDPEPLPPGNPLWSLPNVILTPHVSTRSDLGEAARFAILAENLRRYVAGEKMLSVVDTRKGY